MNNLMPRSWYDLPLVEPADPRSIIQLVQMEDNTGVPQTGIFTRSATWIKNTAWATPPIKLSAITSTTTPFIQAISGQDFDSVYAAQLWNSSSGMVANNPQLPATVQKLMFLKAGPFQNVVFFDWNAGTTSTDFQLSFRDNSAVSGDFTNTSAGTVPVFAWSNTLGGLGRRLYITLTRPGRFPMSLRIIDNAGNWSMFEMDWIVMP